MQEPSAKAGAQIESLRRSPLLVFEPLLSLRVLPPPVRPPLRDALAAAAWPWAKCRCSNCVWAPLRRRCLGTAVQWGAERMPFCALVLHWHCRSREFCCACQPEWRCQFRGSDRADPEADPEAQGSRCQHDFDISLRYPVFLQTEVSLRVQPWSIMTTTVDSAACPGSAGILEAGLREPDCPWCLHGP